ncbi:UxaA family hydrolase [Sphingomonas sp. M1-B02]|uniref:UxaA family hydrolase n=1 Tax=Sphingomonas sp. M1-B02 TaxID=3114300 RepID=UPI00223F0399|nr:altronate dehydratase family protein [Sphingomonas sp. S6-11]UZK65439.1 altronate dehydratase family protein [Sphingomonas sp. S6-11]
MPFERRNSLVNDFAPAAIRLHPDDDVAVATTRLASGCAVAGMPSLIAATPVPLGHKIALTAIAQGAPIKKYGQVIGSATADIAQGAHVHVHNMAVSADRVEAVAVKRMRAEPPRTFRGYRRADGRVGVRNYVGVLTSVNCAATVARHIADAVERSGMLDAYPNVDGVVPVTHSSGCGMASSGEGHDVLLRSLWGTAANPNFAAILIVGLGCEVIQIARLTQAGRWRPPETVRSFMIQDSGGTRLAIARGLEELAALLPAANAQERTEVPASELIVGLQCGGSDAWSGITSNPALGNAVDRLVALGGTALLSETPEIYGAEHLLYERADAATAAKLRAKLEWWEEYTERHGAQMDNNPSPGNKAGGLTTILEKSLGAVAKAGSAPLSDVIGYAEPVQRKGLIFMDSPGFDPCSATGQVASGATLIAFTTGRGSAFGYKPSPSLKLSSNSGLFERMGEDIDLDCGTIVSGEATIEQKGAEILDLMLRVASGEESKSEKLGYGGAEFVPWQIGAVM